MKKKPKAPPKRDVRLDIRLSDEELARIAATAKENGEGVSTWARRNLLALTRRK
jgi:predicted DNA binding CopG/RHH family protein